MKVLKSKWIPFKGFTAINLFGVIVLRKGKSVSALLVNHERIHSAQMLEMLFVPFYLFYLIEWGVRLFMKGDAYRNISFEREAYANQADLAYLEHRRHFAWIKYLKKRPKKRKKRKNKS